MEPGERVGDLWVIDKGLQAGRERDRDRPAVRAAGHDRSRSSPRRAPPRRARPAPLPRAERAPWPASSSTAPSSPSSSRSSPSSSGLVSMTGLPDRAVPVDHPPADPDPDHLHGRRRRDHRAVRGHAPRAADERRRQDALHAVHERQRRDDDPHRHVRRGERGQHRPGERAEPRVPGPAQPARGREPVRHHLPEHRRPAPRGLRALLAERHLRLALPRQLRADQRQRRALPRARSRPGRQLRPLRVLDAHLGEAGQARQARPHRARPRAGGAAAERREPRGAGGRRARAARASSSPTPCARKGRLVTAEEFGRGGGAHRTPRARWCGSRTWPASSWAR